jgi:hypothetical protein
MIIYIDHESKNEIIPKNYGLFLDDIRKVNDVLKYTNNSKFYENVTWVICRNYKEFTDCIFRYHIPLKISFDHDLGQEHYHPSMYSDDKEDYNKLYSKFKEKTGYHCAQWAVEYCQKNNLPFPEYVCHSMNPIGKANIESYVENFKRVYELL